MSTRHRSAGARWLDRIAARLDSVLGEFVGSAQVGPYVPPDPNVRLLDPGCPHCGQPISRHQTDRTKAIGRLYCPALKSVTQSAEGTSSVAHPIG